MRKITNIDNYNQDDIKALYFDNYKKLRYRDLKILIKGVNDDYILESTNQDEISALYGLDKLTKSLSKEGVIVKGMNDEIKIKVSFINYKNTVKSKIVTFKSIEEIKVFKDAIVELSKPVIKNVEGITDDTLAPIITESKQIVNTIVEPIKTDLPTFKTFNWKFI